MDRRDHDSKTYLETLAPRHHFHRRPTVHVRLIEYDVGSHMCWPGGQHLLLAHHEIGCIEGCQLESMAMRDRVRWASLDAISAENAAVVIDVIDLGVAFRATDTVLCGVLSSLDIDAIGGAIRRAQEAGHTLFQPIFVPLQDVGAAEAGFNARSAQRTLAIRIVFHDRGLEHLRKGDAHPLGDRRDVLQH